MPAFYNRPKTVDDIINHTVGRLLDLFGIETDDGQALAGRPGGRSNVAAQEPHQRHRTREETIMDQETYDAGMKMRRKVAGDEYVDKAMANVDDFNRDFQRIVTQYCWGEAWGDATLPPRERSILNLGMIASLGRMEEFQTHVRGALNNGMTPNEIRAVLTQIAVYCGIPCGVDCFRHASPIIEEYRRARGNARPARPAPNRAPKSRALRSTSSATLRRWNRPDWWCAIDRPIDKDTELHPLVRWQFLGGLPEDKRRAFLFTNVDRTAAAGATTCPVVVGALAASPQIYAIGMGKPVEEIGNAWIDAVAHPIPPVRVNAAPCQEVVIQGDDIEEPDGGLEAPAGADLDAGLRRRALSHRDALHHQGPRHRRPEHGHLPRRPQGHRPARRAHGVAHRRRRRLSALAEVSQAEDADAVRHRGRLRAGRDLHRAAEARHRHGRDGRSRARSPASRSAR